MRRSSPSTVSTASSPICPARRSAASRARAAASARRRSSSLVGRGREPSMPDECAICSFIPSGVYAAQVRISSSVRTWVLPTTRGAQRVGAVPTGCAGFSDCLPAEMDDIPVGCAAAGIWLGPGQPHGASSDHLPRIRRTVPELHRFRETIGSLRPRNGRYLSSMKFSLILAVAIPCLLLAHPAAAGPPAGPVEALSSGDLTTSYVQYRRFGHRPHRFRRGYGYRRGPGVGAAIGAGAAGLAAGAIIGGAIANSQAQAAQGAADAEVVAACARRFRSYDAASGTYLGNDGARHPCP